MTTSDDPEGLFRRAADEALTFRRGVAERKQRPEITYGEALARWDAPTPESRAPADAVLEEMIRLSDGGLHAMTGPRFYGWVIGGSHPAGVAADWLVSARGRQFHPREAERARIPVELYRHPLMLVAGGDDRICPTVEMARNISRRRAEVGPPTETLIYPEGGHRLGDDGYSSAEWSLRSGGTLQGNAVARRDAFVQALRFLEETFGPVAR